MTYARPIYLIAMISACLLGCSGANPDAGWRPEYTGTLYQAAPGGVHSRWVSPENPDGEKGRGGRTNRGAKGNAFYIVAPGETKTLFDVSGAGMITRMWLSGTIGVNPAQRRAVRIDMYWDGSKKTRGIGPGRRFLWHRAGIAARFDNELFSSPEARSFNFTIPMPYRSSAHISITNDSQEEVWIWYDINYLQLDRVPDDALYFHAYWNRNTKTTPGVDHEILPRVEGRGRYIGTNIGVIGDTVYRGTWFGEGEVKIYLDGDAGFPTLVGTGTEDYIGTGWGQGEYASRYFGSPVSDKDNDLYAFYRYHIPDPVYFHRDCRVTIQQMGNSDKKGIIQMKQKGADIRPVWFLAREGNVSYHRRLLDEENPPQPEDADFPVTSTNFYRSDDVSSTAYFYLDRPESSLPPLPDVQVRMAHLHDRVFNTID
jgi:hypothetical protein